MFSLLIVSCSKELTFDSDVNLNADDAKSFIESLYSMSNTISTKSGVLTDQDETEILNSIQPLLAESKTFLVKCGYDSYEEEFSADDPCLIILAEAISDYVISSSAQTDGKFSAEMILTCFSVAVGIGSAPFSINAWFTQGMSKAAIKAASKKLASRCIPYVGGALFAGEMALCLYNNIHGTASADNENIL